MNFKNQSVGKRVQGNVLWLKKAEVKLVFEIFEKLDQVENLKDNEDYELLKGILTQKKEYSRAKTYELTGTVVMKGREKFGKTNESLGIKEGDPYYKVDLDNGIMIYIAAVNLDFSEDFEKTVEAIETGKKYTFEAELWMGKRYRLRNLVKKHD